MGSIVIAERTIQYRVVAGPAARGQRVLYVHGTGCNSEVWMPHTPSWNTFTCSLMLPRSVNLHQFEALLPSVAGMVGEKLAAAVGG